MLRRALGKSLALFPMLAAPALGALPPATPDLEKWWHQRTLEADRDHYRPYLFDTREVARVEGLPWPKIIAVHPSFLDSAVVILESRISSGRTIDRNALLGRGAYVYNDEYHRLKQHLGKAVCLLGVDSGR